MNQQRSMNEKNRVTLGGDEPFSFHERGGAADITGELLRVITKKELRLIVPYSSQHILRLEKRGKFPKRIQLGARRVGWYLHEVHAWLRQRSRGSSSFKAPCL